jgi:hypothetical protein
LLRVKVKVGIKTITRVMALSIHGQRFLELSGIDREKAKRVSHGINQRWLEAVAVYAQDSSGYRVLEQEFAIDWGEHDRLNETAPVIDVSQPGWENELAVEVEAICARFRETVETYDLTPRFWVRFTRETHKHDAVYRERCRMVGVQPGGSVPAWKSTFTEESLSVTGLGESRLLVRCVENL